MKATESAIPSEPPDLPPVLLRSELLQPGDVLLTLGDGWEVGGNCRLERR
jgi:hypothetical protein